MFKKTCTTCRCRPRFEHNGPQIHDLKVEERINSKWTVLSGTTSNSKSVMTLYKFQKTWSYYWNLYPCTPNVCHGDNGLSALPGVAVPWAEPAAWPAAKPSKSPKPSKLHGVAGWRGRPRPRDHKPPRALEPSCHHVLLLVFNGAHGTNIVYRLRDHRVSCW